MRLKQITDPNDLDIGKFYFCIVMLPEGTWGEIGSPFISDVDGVMMMNFDNWNLEINQIHTMYEVPEIK